MISSLSRCTRTAELSLAAKCRFYICFPSLRKRLLSSRPITLSKNGTNSCPRSYRLSTYIHLHLVPNAMRCWNCSSLEENVLRLVEKVEMYFVNDQRRLSLNSANFLSGASRPTMGHGAIVPQIGCLGIGVVSLIRKMYPFLLT